MIYSIRLQNYRSYTDTSFEFDNGVNIVVGPNASGKTNLIEAIGVSLRGKSFRGYDGELVAHDSGWARLDVHLDNQARSVKLQRSQQKIQKTIIIDKQEYKRLSAQRRYPFVLFEPGDLRLLHGSPERRREFIDDLLEGVITDYGSIRRDYRRTLAQRNAYLKQYYKKANHDDLFVWDVRLSELGSKMVKYRKELLRKIEPSLQATYQDVASSKKTIQMNYDSDFPADSYQDAMLKRLRAGLQRDIELGFTTTGPHRDDIGLAFDNVPAKQVASRGETRTVVLALKIIEMQMLDEAQDKTPVLLLDDVFSELDGARRKHLTEHLRRYQTFITTTDADIVVQHFMKKCHIIPLSCASKDVR